MVIKEITSARKSIFLNSQTFFKFRHFLGDQRGNIIIMAALLLPLFVGAMGLGVEISYRYQQQRKIQNAADLGVHAAAVRWSAGDASSAYEPAGEFVAEKADWKANDGTATWNIPPSQGAFTSGTGPNGGDVIELVLTESQPRLFSSIYDSSDVVLTARAVAEVQVGAEACILSLSETDSGATSLGGNTTVTLTSCVIASNSNAPDAYDQYGNATLTADCISVVGQAETTAQTNLTKCWGPKEYQKEMKDPYEDVVQPIVEGPCVSWRDVDHLSVITPSWPHTEGVMSMRFCSRDVQLHDTYTFAPGLYILDGVDMTANASGVLNGTNVTIFLTDGARLRLNGQGQLNVKARTSDPWSGIAIFGDRNDPGVNHKINGGSASIIQGAVYVPVADILFNGGSDATDACTQIIGYTVEMTGNSDLSIDCTNAGTNAIETEEFVELIE